MREKINFLVGATILLLSLGQVAAAAPAADSTSAAAAGPSSNVLKLHSEVIKALGDKRLPITSLTVNVDHSSVQLCGFVPSKEGRQALAVVKNLPDVKKAVNGMVYTDSSFAKLNTNERGGYINSATLTAAVKSKLLIEPKTPGMSINVQTYRGIVNLCGFVGTGEEKKTAVKLAEKVGGVHKVFDNLVVTTPNS